MWLWKLNSRRMLLTKVLFVLFNQLMVIAVYGKLCETETGQNNIILDIEESRGNGECKKNIFSLILYLFLKVIKSVVIAVGCMLRFHLERFRMTFTFENFIFIVTDI